MLHVRALYTCIAVIDQCDLCDSFPLTGASQCDDRIKCERHGLPFIAGSWLTCGYCCAVPFTSCLQNVLSGGDSGSKMSLRHRAYVPF